MKRINKEEIIIIIKYIFSAGSSFIIDLSLFTLFKYLLTKSINLDDIVIIFISTTIARVLSSIYNYLINSRIVFKNKDRKTIIGYFILVIIQMIASAAIVSALDNITKIDTTIIKFFVDIVIFIVNYIIQKEIIFKKRGD